MANASTPAAVASGIATSPVSAAEHDQQAERAGSDRASREPVEASVGRSRAARPRRIRDGGPRAALSRVATEEVAGRWPNANQAPSEIAAGAAAERRRARRVSRRGEPRGRRRSPRGRRGALRSSRTGAGEQEPGEQLTGRAAPTAARAGAPPRWSRRGAAASRRFRRCRPPCRCRRSCTSRGRMPRRPARARPPSAGFRAGRGRERRAAAGRAGSPRSRTSFPPPSRPRRRDWSRAADSTHACRRDTGPPGSVRPRSGPARIAAPWAPEEDQIRRGGGARRRGEQGRRHGQPRKRVAAASAQRRPGTSRQLRARRRAAQDHRSGTREAPPPPEGAGRLQGTPRRAKTVIANDTSDRSRSSREDRARDDRDPREPGVRQERSARQRDERVGWTARAPAPRFSWAPPPDAAVGRVQEQVAGRPTGPRPDHDDELRVRNTWGPSPVVERGGQTRAWGSKATPKRWR